MKVEVTAILIIMLLNGVAAALGIAAGGSFNYGLSGANIAVVIALNTVLSKVLEKE